MKDINVTQRQYHRNGICGEPFQVFLFEGEGRNMLGVVFPDTPGACAVFDVDMLAKGDITFGSNSWRGDRFETALLADIE